MFSARRHVVFSAASFHGIMVVTSLAFEEVCEKAHEHFESF
jgi:hypothetical protein